MSAPGHCASGMTGAAPPVNEQQRLDDPVPEYLRARRYGNDLIAEGIGQALDIIRGEEPGQPSQHGGEA